jgi:hypothetical protein
MTHLNSKNTAAATPVDYSSIARVASAVELRDIALRSSRASLNAAATEIPEHWSGAAFVGFDSKVGKRAADDRDFTIEAAFIAVYNSGWADEIHTELPEADPAHPPEIEIEASFELSYRAAEDAELAAEDLDNFAIANGTLHAWPYWRELADDITMRMHVPRLVVGVFKIPSRHDPGGRPEAPAPENASKPEGNSETGTSEGSKTS